MTQQKKGKKVENKADDRYFGGKESNEPAKVAPKSNKKLEVLWDDVADRWNRLNKYLTQQGLGQNARQKVVEYVKEIKVIQDKIAKEEE